MLHAIAPSRIPWSSRLPPGRLSPPWALFGQGPYLQHSDRLHPSAVVSGSPGAERNAKTGPDLRKPLFLHGVSEGSRPLLGWAPRGSEASLQPVPEKGGHLSVSLRIKKPHQARGLLGARVPPCQVRPAAPNPRGTGGHRAQAAGHRQLPAPPLGTGQRGQGPSRISPAPALPEGPGRGR